MGICDRIINFILLFKKPEYAALLLTAITIIVTVIIANNNRKYSFAKEEYFKLQQIAEKIISKLLVLYNQSEKLQIYIQGQFNAHKLGKPFIDTNNTLDKSDFNKDIEEVVALITIYFDTLGEDWNICMTTMSKCMTLAHQLKLDIDDSVPINWEGIATDFNNYMSSIEGKPKKLSDAIKQEIENYKNNNLK